MADVKKIKTPVLRQAYEESGPAEGERVLLVHGWPDSPRTWDKVLPELHAAGYRTVVPYLRGYGPSKFRSKLLGRSPRHTGQSVAYAQDMADLTRRLGMKRFHFVGHDWGARAAHAFSALFPERLKSMVTISVPFQPVSDEVPPFPQAQASWYQWLLCTEPGKRKFREDPVAFGRAQWNAWSPKGWYSEKEFAETAKSWKGKAFKDVVLHAYRSRWGHAPLDPAYARQQKTFAATKTLKTPTLLLHGEVDRCLLAEMAEGAAKYHAGPYELRIVPGVGHFVQREDPARVAAEVLEHMRRWS